MIANVDLIAYEYAPKQFTPKPVYVSGEKEEDSIIDKYRLNKDDLAVLVLEDDIVNKEGYGLKRGFYNVVATKYLDFLLIYQKGDLKAKIPVIQIEVFDPVNPEKQKVKRMSQRQYQKYIEKEKRRYFKGENPNEYKWSNAQIKYFEEQKAYLLIYTCENYELSGVIKF